MSRGWWLVTGLVVGALACWGWLASQHRAEVRAWQDAVAAEEVLTAQADSARRASDAARLALGERFAWLAAAIPDTVALRAEARRARQAARDALEGARTTSDSLGVVIVAFRGAEGRESALADTVAGLVRTVAAVRAAGLARFAADSVALARLTGERDRWRELARAAPVVGPEPGRWILGLPRPRCVVGPGVVAGVRAGAGLGLTCGLPIG